MVLKGNTVIELFDAKTGNITNRVESENLVTNAVSNILNGSLNALICGLDNGLGSKPGLDYIYTLPSGYNIAKALFGGVLIFSSNLNETVDHIIPTIDEMRSFIGCANQGSSVTGNIFKGSLNKSESVVGDNYVKFVWDFTTEQCNGDIACICLTSDKGGSQGYKFSAYTEVEESQSLTFPTEGMWDTSSRINFSSSYCHYPMFKSSFTSGNAHDSYINGNNFYYVYRGSVYRYDISRLSKIGINLQDAFNYGRPSNYDELITLDDYEDAIFNCLDDDKVYEFNSSQTDSTNLNLVKISGNGNKTDISIPSTNILASIGEYLGISVSYLREYAKCSAIFNDKIYILVGQINNTDLTKYPNKLRMYVLSFDGTFTYKDINVTDNMVSMLFGTNLYIGDSVLETRFNKVFGSLVLQSVNVIDSLHGYTYYLVSEDGGVDDYPFMSTYSELSSYGKDLYKNSDCLKEPWCSFKFPDNGYHNSIELWTPYLATINNQDVVLTKTADKTMKIIYTLTQS